MDIEGGKVAIPCRSCELELDQANENLYLGALSPENNKVPSIYHVSIKIQLVLNHKAE